VSPEGPPVILCRSLPCRCKPGEGHNDPRWVAYEAALDELETELATSLTAAAEVKATYRPDFAPAPPRDISPEWKGDDGGALRDWVGAPGRIGSSWTGMAYELRFVPERRRGCPAEVLSWGNRLERIRSETVDGEFMLVPVTARQGDLHVPPHRGCILR